MMADIATREAYGLEFSTVHWNLTAPALYEEAIKRGEAKVGANGPLIVDTGKFTGRSPKDKFIVRDESTENLVDWKSSFNQSMTPDAFANLKAGMRAFMQDRDLFVQDLYVGTDEGYQIPVRIITQYAWHSLFARNLLIRQAPTDSPGLYTVIDLPGFRANPDRHGSLSNTVIAMNLKERLVLIGNTEYAGEIKKSLFSIMNYELPQRYVLPMHCSANHDDKGKVAVYFGLSGTGKTTLSADPNRILIGDDEHGWSNAGVFNFEGGCYAKVIDLSAESEPEIYATTQTFGTILENIGYDPDTRVPDFKDRSKTENTRAAYPIGHIPNASKTGRGGHPKDIIFLSADAFGVLPPISKLSREQAMYYFLSGYTAKVAGTERGVTEPTATFSSCFGAPFLPLRPSVYAELLGKKIDQHQVNVWLINTGWTGGPYGVGSRMRLSYTRAMLRAALDGELNDVPMVTHPVFGLNIPAHCSGVPSEILDPRNTWLDKEGYDAQTKKLAEMFKKNFKQFEASVSETVIKAGPY
ncbi:MAG: phosphoenolpyruvate carboxykinase [Deinococcales bacterium]